MLYASQINDTNFYYITHDLCQFGDMDSDMCILLGISRKEYICILQQFNATPIDLSTIWSHSYCRDEQYLFESKLDAQKCAEHFEEVYITLQKLAGFDFGV